MKLGLELGEFAWDGGTAQLADTLKNVVRTADDAGFSIIGVSDHLWQGPHAGGAEAPMLECFTTLATIAAHTSTARLAPIVAGVHLRAPAVLAKSVSTLDILSGGRAILGIGTAWYDDEARGLGIAYPSLAERFEMLEETVRICRNLWTGERGTEEPFHGKHFQLERQLNVPNLARPLPILIGGGGEKKTLPLVARYADLCNLYPTPDLADKLAVLRRLCDAEGRDYDAIEKTVILPFAVGPDGAGAADLAEMLRGFAGAGVQTAIGIVSTSDPLRQVELLADKVLPAVADA